MPQSQVLTDTGPAYLLPGHYLVDHQALIVSFTPTGGFSKRSAKEMNLTGLNFFDLLARTPALQSMEGALRRQLELGLEAPPMAFPAINIGNLEQLRLLSYPVRLSELRLLAVVIEPPGSSASTGLLSSFNSELTAPTTASLSAVDTGELSVRQLSVLLTVSSAIHSGETTEVIFRVIANEARKLLPFDRASITLLKGDTSEVEVFALTEEQETGLRVGTFAPAENTVTAWVVKHGKPVVTQDFKQNSSFVIYSGMLHHGYRAALCYPLKVEGQTLGTLNFTSRTPNQYGQEHLNVVSPLAEQAAIAIQKAMLLKRLEEQSIQLKHIIEVGNEVKHHVSLEVVLDKISQAVYESGWRRAVFSLHDEAQQVSQVTSFAGEFSEDQRAGLEKSRTVPMAEFPREMYDPQYRISRSYFFDQRLETPLQSWHSSDIGVVPMASEGKLLGMLSVDGLTSGTRPSRERIELLEMFADQAAIAIRNARLIAALQSRLDEVTHLQRLERLWAEQMRHTEKLRALGELASEVVYNFNNLLTIILGRAQMLNARIPDPTIKRHSEIIEQVAKDAAKIVRRIQDLSRTRQDTDDFQVVDMSYLVREVVEMTKPRWKDELSNKGLTIEVVCEAEEGVSVQGNPTELREILTNLILNAVDALPTGGTIAVRVKRVGEQAELTVQDTGVGMTEEVRQRIFTPFFSTKMETGTGLGLSVTLSLVNRHKGRIQIASAPDKGSIFSIFFPLAGAATKAPLPDMPIKTLGVRLRVLIVDSDTGACVSTCKILESLHHTVCSVTQVQQALEMLLEQDFDVLFTEQEMPDLDCWQLIEAARRISSRLIVVLMTSDTSSLDTKTLQFYSIDYLVRKPLDVNYIQHVLKSIMKQHEP